jgi:hypothetical protein
MNMQWELQDIAFLKILIKNSFSDNESYLGKEKGREEGREGRKEGRKEKKNCRAYIIFQWIKRS